MSWDDTRLLVVSGGVTSELKNLSCKVLEDSSEVDWSTGTNSDGVVAPLHEPVDTTNWELETSSARSGG